MITDFWLRRTAPCASARKRLGSDRPARPTLPTLRNERRVRPSQYRWRGPRSVSTSRTPVFGQEAGGIARQDEGALHRECNIYPNPAADGRGERFGSIVVFV